MRHALIGLMAALGLARCGVAWAAPIPLNQTAQDVSPQPSDIVPILPSPFTGTLEYVTVGALLAGASGAPAGLSGQIQYNNAGAFGAFTLGGDCGLSLPIIVCTKTGGVAFAASATTDTTNASDITSGALAAARLAAGAAVVNIGYTPLNQAGDIMSGLLKVQRTDNGAIQANFRSNLANLQAAIYCGHGQTPTLTGGLCEYVFSGYDSAGTATDYGVINANTQNIGVNQTQGALNFAAEIPGKPMVAGGSVIISGGGGYVNNEVVTLYNVNGGASLIPPARAQVTVSAGVVLSFTVFGSNGLYPSANLPTELDQASTTGSGSGLRITPAYASSEPTVFSSVTPNSVQASAVYTISTAVPLDGETVTFGAPGFTANVYTFRTSPTVNGDVHIGASISATATNLANAISDSGGTPGTDYVAAAASSFVSAVAGSSTVTVTALAAFGGYAGDQITAASSVGSSTHGAGWSSATLAGGKVAGVSTNSDAELEAGGNVLADYLGNVTANTLNLKGSTGQIINAGNSTFGFGPPDNGLPGSQTIKLAPSAINVTDRPGATGFLKPGTGTGTGLGGAIILEVCPAGSTGTAQNACVNYLQVDGKGHMALSNTANFTPTCAGTGCAIVGNDNRMAITTSSTGGTSTVVTFAKSWSVTPVCVVTSGTTSAWPAITTQGAGTFTLTWSASVTSVLAYAHCE